MRHPVTAVMERIDGLSLRERLMLWCTAILLLAAAWYVLVMSADLARQARIQGEIVSLQARVETLNRGIDEQAELVTGDTRPGIRRRLAQIQQRSRQIALAMETYATELVDPAQMASVMEDVLDRQHGLTLVRMSNLEPEVLVAAGAIGQQALYRHGLKLEIEGSYLAALRYLQDLEALRWRLYWSVVDVDAGDWPGTRMMIEVNTLSLDEDWIGV